MASNALLTIPKACGCAGRSLPIRVDVWVAALIAQSSFAEGALVLTYRCQRCKTIVEVTVADVRSCYKGAA